MLIIHKQVYPEVHSGRFRIIETYPSVDGPRTRITHQVFNTFDEAVEFIQQMAPPQKSFTEVEKK